MDCVCSLWVLGGLGLACCGVLIVHLLTRPARFNPEGRTVLITGGSSGIGKALAKRLVARGAHVALLARRQDVLDEAKKEVDACRAHDSVRVTVHAVDVCNPGAVEAVMADVLEAHTELHAIVCSAGITQPQRFAEISAADWERILKVNVVGTRNPIASALPALTRHRDSRIVMVSSQAGQCGIYGFTSYSASKFALRGFAESLQMELAPYGTRVSIAYPPDTDTPMFTEENKIKPEETKVISGSNKPYSAEQVAEDIFKGMIAGQFAISTGFDGWMLRQVGGGMGPGLFADVVVEALTGGVLRLVAWFVRLSFDSTVVSMYKQRLDSRRENLVSASQRQAAEKAVAPTV
eukprot:m.9690 g.9690  ORF g.9690 m.9690 type:complete len:350 (+) comp4998_c0_seq1:37-1086(+)